MTDKQDWIGRSGESCPAEWRRTDRSFGGLTDRLLTEARSKPFTTVLDVGCGGGEISLALARAHTNADIYGIDVSPSLYDIATSRSGNLSNVTFMRGDASVWKPDDFRPDLLISRHGVMFFDQPIKAFAHLASISAPEARLAFSCFRDRTQNPWAERISALLPNRIPQTSPNTAPGPFAFARREYVSDILQQAGWCDVEFTPFDYAYIAGAGPDPVEDALSFFQKIGPAARPAAQLPPDERKQFLARLRQYLVAQEDNGIVALRAAAWIVSARAPAK
ncbi:MAG: methyltransferase domain-containing protein [Pontixanthobacter sp.]